MVSGAFSLYVSIVMFLNSIIGLISIAIFVYIANNYLRLSEEKRLLKDWYYKMPDF